MKISKVNRSLLTWKPKPKQASCGQGKNVVSIFKKFEESINDFEPPTRKLEGVTKQQASLLYLAAMMIEPTKEPGVNK